MKGEIILAEAVIKGSDTCYSVPGYPVTGLSENCRAEYTVNEKTALEYALGDSVSGLRSVVIVKNAGMNALCDPLVNAVTQGIRGGIVIIAGDDTTACGSQNRQDSRYFAEMAEVPMMEPDGDNIASAVESAMQASEKFSRVCIIRVTPAILEACIEDSEIPQRVQRYGELTPPNLTMRGRSEFADNNTRKMYEWSKPPFVWPPLNSGLLSPAKNTEEVGRKFLKEHQNPSPPEFTKDPESAKSRGFTKTLCKNCPYKTLFEIITDSGALAVMDTGCSLLAKNPPYGFGLANYGLGSSPAVAAKSTKVALTGDYALMHSGINALIDIHQKKMPLLCIVLKNRKMAMTGGQNIPDIMPYISFLDPVLRDASDPSLRALLEDNLSGKRDRLKVIVVEGRCLEGCWHEKISC
ncbi:MAG: indolepyruvate ferredoxin oxidoreductase [Methanomicrobiaceae archaeon]|nr:indolepyruvate ferredoxin oxidoreductase [Methanomicrobiaceae archaeon]